MKHFSIFICIIFFSVTVNACAVQPVNRIGDTPPTTVEDVNLTRYAGKWYEIARYPNSFEKNCTGVTAEYTQLPDGNISVINTCYKGGLDGKKSVAKGRARIVEGTNNSKLLVKFAPEWVPFAEGDYWILGLDEGYQTALVGAPNGKYLWILARAPKITDAKLNEMKAIATTKGYDVLAFEMVLQK